MWFNGKMDEDRINELGWSHDPFDGLKIMKNDINIFMDADEDVMRIRTKIDYLQEKIDFVKRCMENITWRHKQLRTQLNGVNYMSGM